MVGGKGQRHLFRRQCWRCHRRNPTTHDVSPPRSITPIGATSNSLILDGTTGQRRRQRHRTTPSSARPDNIIYGRAWSDFIVGGKGTTSTSSTARRCGRRNANEGNDSSTRRPLPIGANIESLIRRAANLAAPAQHEHAPRGQFPVTTISTAAPAHDFLTAKKRRQRPVSSSAGEAAVGPVRRDFAGNGRRARRQLPVPRLMGPAQEARLHADRGHTTGPSIPRTPRHEFSPCITARRSPCRTISLCVVRHRRESST